MLTHTHTLTLSLFSHVSVQICLFFYSVCSAESLTHVYKKKKEKLWLHRNVCSHCGESQIAGPVLVFPAARIGEGGRRVGLIRRRQGVSQGGVLVLI